MIRQFSWVAAGRVFAAMLQMLSLGLVASLAGPADFGLLAAVLGIAVVPQSLLDFGITTYVTRTRAADVNDGTVTFALLVNSRVSFCLSVATGAALIAAANVSNPLFGLMLPLAVWVGAQRNADALAAVAMADGDGVCCTDR